MCKCFKKGNEQKKTAKNRKVLLFRFTLSSSGFLFHFGGMSVCVHFQTAFCTYANMYK